MESPPRSGFTLIELAIVLVIIAFVAGGILVGRDLTQSATLNRVATDISTHNAAAIAFIDKYNCLPGDCAKAEEYFGTSNGAGAGPCPNASYIGTTGTCNGDGDGKLAFGGGGGADEGLRFWEMLSLAKLLPAKYITRGFGASATEGTAYPRLPESLRRSATAGIRVYWYTAPLFVPAMSKGQIFVVGRSDQGYSNAKAALSPFEAQWLDSKYDDGRPKTGLWKGNNNIYSSCHDGTNYVSSDVYKFTDDTSGTGCALFIGTSF